MTTTGVPILLKGRRVDFVNVLLLASTSSLPIKAFINYWLPYSLHVLPEELAHGLPPRLPDPYEKNHLLL